MTLTIRMAMDADMPMLAAMRRSYTEERRALDEGGDPAFEERFEAWFHDVATHSHWWIAELPDGSAGLLYLFVHRRMPMPTYDPGGWGYIGLVYVRPAHRHRGIGERLLRTAEEEAARMGLTKLLLHPSERAMPLYRRCGYQPADSYLVRAVEPLASP